ncbi:MAG: glycosyltransferase [Proteobacteria bacterium]|uniref:glycosyltransferase n=1 Tax=Rudaea sp. TaxID=2136325 RepID=UPI00321FEA39|nr:glycosyltransferase [Pseudomonadota bacterium]
MSGKPLRVMWLLNHTSARKFEVPMLKRIGIEEIFLPKKYVADIEFRSASVSWEEDANLTIPAEDLAILNEQDWYRSPSRQAWDIANRHFDVLFFIFYKPEILTSIANNFKGAALWRTYGVAQGVTYDSILRLISPNEGTCKAKSMGRRLWFAEAYPHLHEVEPEYLSRRQLYLPLGLTNTEVDDRWTGSDKKIFFVCPNIATNPYYANVYDEFKKSFGDFPYAIGGMQAIDPGYPEVLGFVPQETHERNMREFGLMFYHSTEPNHIHYHPFEAIRAGMPLVYMGGGLLDRLGGKTLPGRCKTIEEARHKIRRILDGDRGLISSICKSQVALLEPMRADRCVEEWRRNMRLVVEDLDATRRSEPVAVLRKKRVAIIVPVGYRGGSLRGAKLLAQAIHAGSRQFGEDADVVLLHLDDRGLYPEEEFDDLPEEIVRRPFNWRTLDGVEATRAMRFAGHEGWEPASLHYIVPDDGIADLMDCDAWIVVSDRLSMPLLPLRPYMLIVYDYLQRYVPIMQPGADHTFLAVARRAAGVMVTTEFTWRDALQYAGVPEERLFRLPMLAPTWSGSTSASADSARDYFLWTTNAAPHKNHERAIEALRIYYEELDGQLRCVVTGVNTANLMKEPPAHLQKSADLFRASKALKKRVRWLGELGEGSYRKTLAGAAFLWHAGSLDNGSFSVVEAAAAGVPSLSSDYPAMREMDAQFSLHLAWMDATRPRSMANALKTMESAWQERKNLLPSAKVLAKQAVGELAGEYWKVVRECL